MQMGTDLTNVLLQKNFKKVQKHYLNTQSLSIEPMAYAITERSIESVYKIDPSIPFCQLNCSLPLLPTVSISVLHLFPPLYTVQMIDPLIIFACLNVDSPVTWLAPISAVHISEPSELKCDDLITTDNPATPSSALSNFIGFKKKFITNCFINQIYECIKLYFKSTTFSAKPIYE